MKFRGNRTLIVATILAIAQPAAAQQEVTRDTLAASEESVFDGDYLSVGIGGAVGPSYDGSNDYFAYPGVLVRGRLQGVSISPRAAGVALDFIKDGDGPLGVDLGIATRLRSNRAGSIKDPVVIAAGKLKRALEVGPNIGIEYEGLFNKYDEISFGSDILFDISGAHSGVTLAPGVSYVTPLSRGVAAQLSVGVQYADKHYSDYYFSVSPIQSANSGLPEYTAKSGFTKTSATLAIGVDLNGNIEDGGFALVFIGSYNRMLGDARRSPFTSSRGDPNQWLGAFGVGYTF
jgi:outer membrane scaffolding protein for murein synthesis (MipA/OmpV family)